MKTQHCPECGGSLQKAGKRLKCEYCDYYELPEKSSERATRFGFHDKIIGKAVLQEEAEGKADKKYEQFRNQKHGSKRT